MDECKPLLVGMHDRGAPAILADEMGLGKTLQTIAFFRALKNLRNVPGRGLHSSTFQLNLSRF